MPAMTFDTILKYNHNHGADGKFSSSPGAGGGASTKTAHERLGQLKDKGLGMVETPISRVSSKKAGWDAQDMWAKVKQKQRKALPEQDVNLSDVKTWQTWVSPDGIKRILDRNGKSASSEPPYAVKYNGELILMDGNHRVAAALLNGEKTMKMKVYDASQVAKRSAAPTGCGVLVLQDGKVLTGTRIERASRGQICGPGGHIEPGENPEEAAKREAMEEFGIECHDLKPLGVQDGGRYGTSAVFLCTDYTGTPRTDEEEMTNPKWLTMRQIRALDAFPPFLRSLDLLPDNTVRKFNPYHGPDGRFASANGATSMTIRTNSAAGQKAIENIKAREKAKAGAGGGGSGSSEAESKPSTTPGGHKPRMRGQELVDYTAKTLGVSEQEANDMIDQVDGFIAGMATDMRTWQQGGKAFNMQHLSPKEAQTMSEQVEKYIQKAPKWDGGTIYRGIGVSDEEANKILDDIAFSMKPVDMKGTSSWTSDKSIADDFADWNASDVKIIFKAPGTKKGTSIDHMSQFDQSEVIVSKDARWDVKNIEGSIDDGYIVIEMEERP